MLVSPTRINATCTGSSLRKALITCRETNSSLEATPCTVTEKSPTINV
jgi:hypothetical protein